MPRPPSHSEPRPRREVYLLRAQQCDRRPKPPAIPKSAAFIDERQPIGVRWLISRVRYNLRTGLSMPGPRTLKGTPRIGSNTRHGNWTFGALRDRVLANAG